MYVIWVAATAQNAAGAKRTKRLTSVLRSLVCNDAGTTRHRASEILGGRRVICVLILSETDGHPDRYTVRDPPMSQVHDLRQHSLSLVRPQARGA